MSEIKGKIIQFFKENPKEFGLVKFSWGGEGICKSMMEGNPPFDGKFLGYGVTLEKIAENDDDQENYYEVFTVYKILLEEGYGANRKEHEFFLKFYGYYQSHDGTYYQDFKEVQPVTKTIEIFE